MSTFIKEDTLKALEVGLSRSIVQKEGAGSAACVRGGSGTLYASGSIETETHLLSIPPEVSALYHALVHRDLPIQEVVLMQDDPSLSPLSAKVLIDAAARIGNTFPFSLVAQSGEIYVETNDVRTIFPLYRSPAEPLEEFCAESYRDDHYEESVRPEDMRALALSGMELHIRSKNTGSRYGAALRTKDGRAYIAGSFSAPDRRLGLHAEMAAFTLLLADGGRDIAEIAIVSEKFPETPCSMCGCCRQFFADIARALSLSDITVTGYAQRADTKASWSLTSLMPSPWTSRK